MKANELIVYSDIDGTLRSFDDPWEFINKNDKKAIEELTKNGGYFSIATGRGVNDVASSIISLCNMPLVLLQGSYVYDHLNEKEVSNDEIDIHARHRLLDYAKKDLDVVLIFSSYDKKYMVELEGNRPRALSSTYAMCKEDFFLTADVLTIELDTNAIHAKEVEKNIELMNLPFMRVVRSADVCVEVFKEECSKSYGIKMAREYMLGIDSSISKRKVACIGDYYNDVEMLRDADISGTPNDAMADIKKLCSIHTKPTREGAVADFIYQILNKK